MTKSERSRIEKIKYRTIVNYFGDTALANKARSYSDERFVREFGLKVPKNMPKIKKKLTERQKAVRRGILEKYQLALLEHDVKEAMQLKKVAKKKIESSNQYQRTLKEPLSAQKEKVRRINLWREWSVKKAIPPRLQKLAEQTNKAQLDPTGKRYQHDDKYGYTAVFYSYTNQSTLTAVRANLQPDIDKNMSPDFKAKRRR